MANFSDITEQRGKDDSSDRRRNTQHNIRFADRQHELKSDTAWQRRQITSGKTVMVAYIPNSDNGLYMYVVVLLFTMMMQKPSHAAHKLS